MANRDERAGGVSRRGFIKAGTAAVAASLAAGCATGEAAKKPDPAGAPTDKPTADGASKPTDAGEEKKKVSAHRRLGRTGFMASDIGMGCGFISEPNLVRYAFDRGVNLFDTAERYENGRSEEKIGQAMPHLDRSQIFLITKIGPEPDESVQSLQDRFAKCLERLKTDYVDALYMHGVSDLKTVKHAAFHELAAKLKVDGKIRHLGLSSHGPRAEEGDSMEQVLLAATEDGRFDLMLLVYSFLKPDEGARVLSACKTKDIGTVIMKATAGVLEIEPFDPDKPTGEYKSIMKRLAARGMSHEESVKRMRDWLAEQEKALEPSKPFIEKYGITSAEQLAAKGVQWVLSNPNAHCVIPSMREFDHVDRYVPVSGQPLATADRRLLEAYARATRPLTCPPGCAACADACPQGVPVNTVLRYTYYYQQQHREKHAMRKYAALGDRSAAGCWTCEAPCRGACPNGLPIQASLVQADQLLTLA